MLNEKKSSVFFYYSTMDKNEGAWNRFMNSMRARLNVAQIVEEVKRNATITFDFLALLMIAGILAAFGLVEDSTIFLASSMLISPLMVCFVIRVKGRKSLSFHLGTHYCGHLWHSHQRQQTDHVRHR